MKNVLLISVLMLSMVARAGGQLQKPQPQPVPANLPVELCALEDDSYETKFDELSTIDIKDAQSLSPFLLGLVNQHLAAEYEKAPQTFEEIKAMFSKGGDEEYNDLYIITFRSKASGKVYIQVKTWPGDNAYGLIFDTQGAVMALNGDDSIAFKIPGEKTIYCSDFQP